MPSHVQKCIQLQGYQTHFKFRWHYILLEFYRFILELRKVENNFILLLELTMKKLIFIKYMLNYR